MAGRLQTILRGNTLGTTLAKVGAGAQNLINLVLVPSITFTQDGKKIDAQVNFAGDFYNDKQLVEHISGFEIAHDDRKFDGAKPIVSKRYEDKDGPKVSMETQRILSKNATLDFVNELSIPDGTPGLFQFSNEEPLVESKKATMEISNVDSGIVSFEKLEKLHTSNDTHLVIADASGSLTNISAELRVPHRAELYFENSQSFSDRFYQGYETLDKEALWGTSSSDVHFIQFPTGSEGKFGDHNTYHYDNRYVFRMIGDVETISGSYPRDKGAFETDYDGTYVSVNNYTASKDFNNQTNIVSNPDIGLGSRPLGITNQFKANTEFTYGGKYLDETFVYPPNHTFLIGTSKDDLDICYDGTQNTGEKFFNSNYWTDLSGDAFYSITNTGQQQATVTYD